MTLEMFLKPKLCMEASLGAPRSFFPRGPPRLMVPFTVPITHACLPSSECVIRASPACVASLAIKGQLTSGPMRTKLLSTPTTWLWISSSTGPLMISSYVSCTRQLTSRPTTMMSTPKRAGRIGVARLAWMRTNPKFSTRVFLATFRTAETCPGYSKS